MYEPQEQEILSITLFTVNFDMHIIVEKSELKKEKRKKRLSLYFYNPEIDVLC